MPLNLPDKLPAIELLKEENIFVIDTSRATQQDIRPLRIVILNLMPLKITTETDLVRLLSNTPLQVEISFMKIKSHTSKNTPIEHMKTFYTDFDQMRHEKYDGMIITGAPVEQMDFEEVTYWDELTRVFDWTQTHVHSTFGVCWGGMAMAWHFHGLEKHMLDHKAFGCLRHRNLAPSSPYLRGFSDDVLVPVSRWTEVRQDEVDARPALKTLIASDQAGPCLLEDAGHRALYVFNHFEYDSTTLKDEYDRDVVAGKPIDVPENYYPDDDPSQPPSNRWRSHAHLLYGNWINEIYQTTEYDLTKIGT